MNIKLLFVFFLVPTIFYAQGVNLEKPDYKKIEKAVKTETSNLYYPKLLERYMQADTSLTLDEKRHLYFGYTHHADYSPYGISDFEDSLRVVFKKNKITDYDLEDVLKFSDSILSEYPLDLKVMNYKLYAYDELRDETGFVKTMIQVNALVDAILSSGDGLAKETAFYVINTSDEYFMLNVLGFQFGGKQRLIEHYDYLTVGKNEHDIEGFYFDVSPCLNSLNKMFEK